MYNGLIWSDLWWAHSSKNAMVFVNLPKVKIKGDIITLVFELGRQIRMPYHRSLHRRPISVVCKIDVETTDMSRLS